jgi:Tol biopolymer transport system component
LAACVLVSGRWLQLTPPFILDPVSHHMPSSHAREARLRGRTELLLLTSILFVLLIACSSGGSSAGGNGPDFLISSAGGLSEHRGDVERVLIAGGGSYVFDPSVSPDGKRIAYGLQPPAVVDANGGIDFGSDLYVANRDGSKPELYLRHSRVGEFLRNPVWLTNDKLLINVRGRAPDGQADLRIESLDLASGVRERILTSAVELALSPNRKSIAYVAIDPQTQSERLAVRDLQTGATEYLLPADNILTLFTSITWSPDGSAVAFAAANPGTLHRQDSDRLYVLAATTLHPTLQDVWVVNRDGTGLRLIADIAESQPSIAWAADGASLYVMGTAAFLHMNLKTGAIAPIGQGVPFGQIVRVDR